MEYKIERVIIVIIGLMLISLGTDLIIQANIGVAPWDVFHQGLTNYIDITVGQACIAVGIVVVAIDCMLKQKVGIGTILNMTLVGVFMDMFMPLIPQSKNMIISLIMIIIRLRAACMA